MTPLFEDASAQFLGKVIGMEATQEMLFGVTEAEIFRLIKDETLLVRKMSGNGQKLSFSYADVKKLKRAMEAYNELQPNGSIIKRLRFKERHRSE